MLRLLRHLQSCCRPGHLPSMASSTSHFRGVDLLEHDTEALQQRCAELEALVMELKRTKRRRGRIIKGRAITTMNSEGSWRISIGFTVSTI